MLDYRSETNYPCFETTEQLVAKFITINEEAERAGGPRLSQEEIDLIMGGNFLRIIGQA